MILAQAGGGRYRSGDSIDHGVAFRYDCRIGDEITPGQVLGVWHQREDNAELTRQLEHCFVIAGEARVPELVLHRVGAEP